MDIVISHREIERAKQMPSMLRTPNRRFLAWRVSVKDDFYTRLAPVSISTISFRLNTSYAKAKALLDWYGWHCLPRKASTDLQLWFAPLSEEFAPVLEPEPLDDEDAAALARLRKSEPTKPTLTAAQHKQLLRALNTLGKDRQ